MSLRPPISTLTDSLFTYTTLFRSKGQAPRIHDLADPINTIVACGGRQALIQAGVIHQDIRGANSEPGSNASLSHAKRASIVAAHMAQQNEGTVGERQDVVQGKIGSGRVDHGGRCTIKKKKR